MNEDNDRLSARRTFSVAFLFRATSMIAFLLAWPLWIVTLPPPLVGTMLIGTGSVLALIVGYRRHGPILVRVGVTFGFFLGVLGIAVYSGGVASVWQARTTGAGVVLAMIVYGLSFPAAIGIMVLLLRAWCWSANDRLIYGSDGADELSRSQADRT